MQGRPPRALVTSAAAGAQLALTDGFPTGAKGRTEALHTGTTAMTTPTELRVSKDRRLLTVTFPDHHPVGLSAELLRVLSPSAEVQGHSPEERKTVPGKRDVAIARIEPVGNYAVRIVFDDLHDTGIYTWDYLHTLSHEKDERFQAYLDELADKGLSRS